MTAKQERWLIIGLLSAIFLFWFFLSKDNYFHWDEWEYLLGFKDLPNYLLNQTHEQYNFLQILHHFILFKIFGLNYPVFQLSQTFWHVVNCFFLYKIVKQLTKRVDLAILVTALFGFSSVSAEAINNSVAMSHQFASILAFGAFWLLLRFQETKKVLLLIISAIFLFFSPMGHGITLLEPLAFGAYVFFTDLPSRQKRLAMGIYLLTGFLCLLTTVLISQSRLTTNIIFSPSYFLVDVPKFVFDGVVRGNLTRFIFPDLYLGQGGISFPTRVMIRNILIVVSTLGLSYGVFRFLRMNHSIRNDVGKKMLQFSGLVTAGYLAAAPTRASFGFFQAIVGRYAYQSFFFLLVLGGVILATFKIRPFRSRLWLVLLIYLFAIHLFASINFQTRYWRPIVDKERDFVSDVRYLFQNNDEVFDLPAKGIFGSVTLSKLWFLYPRDKIINFLPTNKFPKNTGELTTDEKSQAIYRRILEDYNIKTY